MNVRLSFVVNLPSINLLPVDQAEFSYFSAFSGAPHVSPLRGVPVSCTMAVRCQYVCRLAVDINTECWFAAGSKC